MSDEVEPGYVRVRLDLAYDGNEFSGWAKQRSRRTVQGELEAALQTVLRLPRSGRADRRRAYRRRGARPRTGRARRPAGGRCGPSTRTSCCAGWPDGCRATYGSGGSREAPAGFNARFSAIWRRYAYRVGDHPGGVDPLLRGHVLWHDRPLDVDAMNEAARAAARGTRLRRVLQEAGGRDDHPHAPGAALGAGRRRAGRRRPCGPTPSATTWCARWSARCCWSVTGTGRSASPGRCWPAGCGDSAVNVVRPHGLTLEEVGYPADELLAARSREARNMRTLPLPRL